MTDLPESGRQARRARRPSSARQRSGWHAYRPHERLEVPDGAVELAITVESSFPRGRDWAAPSALLLTRSTSRWRLLAESVSAATAEVNSLAGVAPPVPALRLVQSLPRPGLEPVRPLDVVVAHLRRAAERGHPSGLARRRASELVGTSHWEPGPGAVLTCHGPAGTSAQAVVALAGRGDPQAAQPPLGGAAVLRAWRFKRARAPAGPHRESPPGWALAFGIVLASPSGRGLGRAARRYAADAEGAGWTATVLTGTRALSVAMAGDPRNPAPRTAALQVSIETVTQMLTACLAGAASPSQVAHATPPPF
jgi:hypothetical protein